MIDVKGEHALLSFVQLLKVEGGCLKLRDVEGKSVH